MLVTKVKEQHEIKGGKILSSKLFIEITDINFSINTNRITANAQKGYLMEIPRVVESLDADGVTIISETVIEEHKRITAHKKLTYSQEDIKGLMDGNGIAFNSSGLNLLVDDLKSASTLIGQYLISVDPMNNFGITIDKWEVVE